jgi:MazG family protein
MMTVPGKNKNQASSALGPGRDAGSEEGQEARPSSGGETMPLAESGAVPKSAQKSAGQPVKPSSAASEKKIGSAPLPPRGPSPDSGYALARLQAMIDGLLHPLFGCPWDKRQTTKTVTEDFLEEVYELRQALNEDKGPDILEEAGDVAFLLVFLGRLTKEAHNFGLKDFLDAATDKMLTRHPHVFGQDQAIEDMETFWKKWHKLKREAKPAGGVLDSVPVDLPALTRCYRLAQKASRSGFDFPSVAEVRRTLDGELMELDRETALGKTDDPAQLERQAHEIGDVLASVTNLARLLGLSAEKCLDSYNSRFAERFRYMEARLSERGLKPEEAGQAELDRLWDEAKVNLAGRGAARPGEQTEQAEQGRRYGQYSQND